MRITLPNAGTAILRGSHFMNSVWYSFMADVVQALGWNVKTPMYSYLLPSCVQYSSGVTNQAIAAPLIAPGFPTGADETIDSFFKLPPDYVAGTDITPLVEWVTATSDAGNIVLVLAHTAFDDGESMVAATTESKTLAALAVANKITRTQFSDIDGTNLSPGMTVRTQLKRNGTLGADTYGNTASAVAAYLAYQAAGIGYEKVHP